MRKYFAEFIGTFVLVLFACGAAAVLGCSTVDANAAYALTALAFGLVIVGMAYSIGNISGCHINPAVSLAMLISGKMNVKDFVGYVVAQVAGAFSGSAVMLGITGGEFGYGANGLYKDDIVISLIVEVILTCVFVLVILGVTSKAEYSNVAGLVIGFTLTLVHIFGIHFTGTSVNPARSLAPAVFTGGAALSNVWVFIVGPLVGGAIAALIWKVLAKETK